MFPIEYQQPSKEFALCWKAAVVHLSAMNDLGRKRFIRATLTPIILEHLSFVLGNQIFFIHVCDVNNEVKPPSSIKGCIYAAELGNGVPCILEMQKDESGDWMPANEGWGLKHSDSNDLINPVDYMTNQDVEITDWEVADVANLRVAKEIEESGGTILSTNSDPNVHPSVFFLDQEGKPHFVIVVAARYPDEPELEEGLIEKIKEGVSGFATSGFIAEVTLVSVDDPLDPDAKENGNHLPLLRGRGYHQKFSGLLAI
ncbi:hypothetical protein N9H56_00945 [Pseudomonadales bacterium]|nr:hypothetical protein [Pseudomonadales bacterium]